MQSSGEIEKLNESERGLLMSFFFVIIDFCTTINTSIDKTWHKAPNFNYG